MSYYYILMSQKQMFQNDVVEEILRERTDFYITNNKEIDFWIVTSPSLFYKENFQKRLKRTKFYNQSLNEIQDQKGNNSFAVLITTDRSFANWIQLRLGYFESWDNYKSTKNNNIVSDGIAELINKKEFESIKLFDSNSELLHPSIRLKQIEAILNLVNSYKEKKIKNSRI